MMNAITETYGAGEAAVLAFSAGADLILMPEDPDQAIESLIEAVRTGKISLSRVEESLERRRRALTKNNEYELKEASLSNQDEIESKEDRKLAMELISHSIEINNQQMINPNNKGINLIRIDNSLNCPILTNPAPALLIPEAIGYRSLICDELGISLWQKDEEEPLALDLIGNGPILLQIFLRGNPFQGGKEKNEPWLAAVKQLQRKKILAGLIVYGTPYLWKELISIIDPDIAAAYSPGQTKDSQSYLLNRLIKNTNSNNNDQKKTYNIFTD